MIDQVTMKPLLHFFPSRDRADQQLEFLFSRASVNPNNDIDPDLHGRNKGKQLANIKHDEEKIDTNRNRKVAFFDCVIDSSSFIVGMSLLAGPLYTLFLAMILKVSDISKWLC